MSGSPSLTRSERSSEEGWSSWPSIVNSLVVPAGIGRVTRTSDRGSPSTRALIAAEKRPASSPSFFTLNVNIGRSWIGIDSGTCQASTLSGGNDCESHSRSSPPGSRNDPSSWSYPKPIPWALPVAGSSKTTQPESLPSAGL